MKVHLLPRPDSQITACRKYGLFDEEDIIKYGWTKAQQLERGGTHDVKEVTNTA